MLKKILYPIHIHDLASPIFSTPDVIFDGINQYEAKRSIFSLQDLLLHKGQILSQSENGEIINIIGTKSERRNYRSHLGLTELLKINHAESFQTTDPSFIFLPHNPNKKNYWHCLIDNISQLLFVLQNSPKLNVFMPQNTGPMITNYVKFIQTLYDFNLYLISEKSCSFPGPVYLTEPSVLGEFTHNKSIGLQMLQQAERELSSSTRKITKRHFKFGSVPHAFDICSDIERATIKNYSIPWSCPLRQSTFSALHRLGKKASGDVASKPKITFVTRGKGKQKNPKNEQEILKNLKMKTKIHVVDFAELSFEEQIRISANSRCLIGVHGAGLTNMAFMPRDTTIIDIMPPDYSMPCTTEFACAATALGLQYRRVDGKKLGQGNDTSYIVDIHDLTKITNSISLY